MLMVLQCHTKIQFVNVSIFLQKNPQKYMEIDIISQTTQRKNYFRKIIL